MTNFYKLLTLLLLAALLPSQATAYDFMVDGIAYNIKPNGTAEVTYTTLVYEYPGYGDNEICMNYYGKTNINIPETVEDESNTYVVASIGDSAFYGCESLKSIIISNSVTSIGTRAFMCCWWLQDVTLSNSLNAISEEMFKCCYHLNNIIIPNSVTTIGNRAFEDVSITQYDGSTRYTFTSIEIPNSVNTIGDYAFQGSSLESITLPNSITQINDGTFSYTHLSSIDIPNSVTSIGEEAFYNSRLESIDIPTSVTSIGARAFAGSNLTTIPFPSTVTTIGEGMFSDCYMMREVEIPNFITSIGNDAFKWGGSMYDHSLRSVTIPNSVQSIGEGAFYMCWELKRKGIHSQIMNPMEIPFSAFYCEYDFDYIEWWSGDGQDWYPDGDMLYKKAKLYVPRGTMELYKQTSGWKNFVNIEEYDLPVDNPVGDVTGDGNVDIGDVNAVINMMLGKTDQTTAGDVTGDGSVDIGDVNAVINIMLGKE